MKILFLFDFYFPYIGGAEVVNRQIAEYFNRKDEITVCSKNFNGFYSRQERVNGVKVIRCINVFRFIHSITCFFSAYSFAKRADIIFCATYASGLTGRWLSFFLKKKSVLLVHEVLSENWKYFKNFYFLYYLYEKWIVTQKFDLYIAVSRYTKKRLVEYGVPAEKITVVHNGVETDVFTPRPLDTALRKQIAGDSKLVYLFFGRPGGSKGLEYLIQAVPEIKRSVPESRLILILGQEQKNTYRMFMEMIQSLGLSDSITVLPSMPRDKLPDYINIADVVVVPSLSEGFGFTAAESCALGKKLVATDVGSLPEVVYGRVVMVEKADPKAIAEGVLKAYRGEYEVIPEKRFEWNAALTKYDEALKKLVDS